MVSNSSEAIYHNNEESRAGKNIIEDDKYTEDDVKTRADNDKHINERMDGIGEGDNITITSDDTVKRADNAEATSAILSAELVAIRGRHEEEKRQLINTNSELRRRNEELELRCLQLQRLTISNTGVAKIQTHIDDEEEISFPTTSRDDEDGDTSKLVAALRE